jgi:hypothetical protein
MTFSIIFGETRKFIVSRANTIDRVGKELKGGFSELLSISLQMYYD